MLDDVKEDKHGIPTDDIMSGALKEDFYKCKMKMISG